MYILKYILLIAIIYVFLTYISKSKMNNEKILQIIIIAVVGMWILNNVIFKKRRKIVVRHVLPRAIKQLPRSARASEMKIPITYKHRNAMDDHTQTGIVHNYNGPINPLLQHGQFEKQFMPYNEVLLEMKQQGYGTDNIGMSVSEKPGYYLSLNGEYSQSGVSYEHVDNLIRKSKLHDLKHQHNYNIPCSPHTHIGKARVRLNWVRAVKN